MASLVFLVSQGGKYPWNAFKHGPASFLPTTSLWESNAVCLHPQQKMSFAFKTMKCFCVCIFTMSVCSLYLVPFGNSSNSMASFLLSQPTGYNRETFYILGQAGSLSRTVEQLPDHASEKFDGEYRMKQWICLGLKDPDGKGLGSLWMGPGVCIGQLPDLPWTHC